MKNICVYGASSNAIEQMYFDETFKLGKLIATNNFGLVYGCGGTGVMGAVARGVRAEAGYIIGVVPDILNVDELVYHECDEKIVTKTMRERKKRMEELAYAFVCAPGGIGTYEEFFEMLTLKQLRQHEKAIVIFNVNHCYDKLIEMIDLCIMENFAKKETCDLYSIATTPEEVVEQIKNYKFVKTGSEWLTHMK